MPALGMAQETGKVLRWLKAEGDRVAQGEPLLEIETDKATVELEAPGEGILARVSAAVGESVPVGQVIALILTPGETVPTATPVAAPLPAASAAPGAAAPPAPPATAPSGPPHRVQASPKARRLARERGVDLAPLTGSGPGGAVLAADLAAAPALSTTWRLMAERTAQSWMTVPHFFLFRIVDASTLIQHRDTVRPQVPDLTYTDLLVKAVALALREHPQVNARWEQGGIVTIPAVNIGVAVAADRGLVVPVIHGADRLTLAEITGRRTDLVARARDGKLRPDDLRDGTFTISNLGMYAVDAFTAIINPPQAAILAVGRIADRVVAIDGAPAVRPTLALSLSCDHRVIDGARGAAFLDSLADLLETRPAHLA
jgi:pyruvate dehydrogenase E2 component (dihydrolipoamide acetyltransferase)